MMLIRTMWGPCETKMAAAPFSPYLWIQFGFETMAIITNLSRELWRENCRLHGSHFQIGFVHFFGNLTRTWQLCIYEKHCECTIMMGHHRHFISYLIIHLCTITNHKFPYEEHQHFMDNVSKELINNDRPRHFIHMIKMEMHHASYHPLNESLNLTTLLPQSNSHLPSDQQSIKIQ